MCNKCKSLKEITLGKLDTAYGITTQEMFNGVNTKDLKINHTRKFEVYGDEEISYLSEQIELLNIDNITQICKIYKHNAEISSNENLADIYYSIQNAQKSEIKSYQVIEKMIENGDIAFEFIEFNTQEELDKLICKQQILGGHYAIFKGLIVLFNTQLNSLIILTDKS